VGETTLTRDPDGPQCPICGEPLAGRPAVACRDCGTGHHVDCWQFNRGCAIYACSCRRAEDYDCSIAMLNRPRRFVPSCDVVDLATGHEDGTAVVLTIGASMLALLTYGYLWSFGPGEKSATAYILFVGLFFAWFVALVAVTAKVIGYGYALVHPVLEYDSAVRNFRRYWSCCGRQLGSAELWRIGQPVIEIHHHHCEQDDLPTDSVYLALADGSRRLVYDHARSWYFHRLSKTDLAALTEALAENFCCSVRLLHTARAPSREDIMLAAANKAFGMEQPLVQVTGRPPASPCSKDKDPDAAPVRRMEPTTCRICSRLLAGDVVRCTRCETVFHTSCRERSSACPVPGCGGRTTEKPSTVSPSQTRFSCILHDDRLELTWLLTIVAFLAIVTATLWWSFSLSVALWSTILAAFVAAVVIWTGCPFRRQLEFDPRHHRVDVRLVVLGLNTPFVRPWTAADDIVEVHQHWENAWFDTREFIQLCLKNGRRVRVLDQSTDDTLARGRVDADKLADDLARFADATVRFFRSAGAPPALTEQRDGIDTNPSE